MGEGIVGITAAGWLCIVGYALLPIAWWWHRRGLEPRALAVLMLCAGLIRLGPSLDPCLHEWDERYHALVAKHLLEHPLKPTLYDDPMLPHDVGSWAGGHVWLNKPPLSLWSIAVSLKCFGLSPLAVRLPSLLLSVVAVALLYGLARTLASRRVALWAALLFAIHGHLTELASGRTSNDHPDTFLLVFVLAALFAAARMARSGSLRWAVACGVLSGLAFLSKSWPALVIVPVAALFLFGRAEVIKGRTLKCIGVLVVMALLVTLPWNIYAATAFAQEATVASTAHWRHFTMDIEEHGRPWTYYWTQLPMIHGELTPIALIWFMLVPFRKAPREHAALLVWWLLPYLVFSFAVTKMPGYTAIAAPATCIIIGMAIEHWSSASVLPKVLHVPALICAAGLVLLPLRSSVDRTRPWTRIEVPYVVPTELMQASSRTISINCPHPIEMMFHTPVAAAYMGPLAPGETERLSALGYVILDRQGWNK